MVILIVEDEALVAMMLEDTLADAGHEVIGPVPTVGRALALAQQTRPDLALVDINLSEGGSGIDLAREMLRRWGTPSLFVSGQRMEARANQDAALGFLSKPYSPETVIASVKVAKHIIDEGLPPPPAETPAGLEIFAKAD